MHRRAKTILDLVSTGRLDRFRCHAMPRYGAACRNLRRRDSNNGIDQVTCCVTVRLARWIEIGRLIEADLLGRGLQREGRKWWALRHRFSCLRLSGSRAVMRSAARRTSSEFRVFLRIPIMPSLGAITAPLFSRLRPLPELGQRQPHCQTDQLRATRSERALGHERAQLHLRRDGCEEGGKGTRPLMDGPATFGSARFTSPGQDQRADTKDAYLGQSVLRRRFASRTDWMHSVVFPSACRIFARARAAANLNWACSSARRTDSGVGW